MPMSWQTAACHTPGWFQVDIDCGKGLKGAVPGQTMEYWVHPSGYEIWQIADQKRDVPPIEDCTGVSAATLELLRDTISAETAEKKDLEGEKGRLEKMDKTTDDYCQQYDEYIQSLGAMKARIDKAVDDIKTMGKVVVEMMGRYRVQSDEYTVSQVY